MHCRPFRHPGGGIHTIFMMKVGYYHNSTEKLSSEIDRPEPAFHRHQDSLDSHGGAFHRYVQQLRSPAEAIEGTRNQLPGEWQYQGTEKTLGMDGWQSRSTRRLR